MELHPNGLTFAMEVIQLLAMKFTPLLTLCEFLLKMVLKKLPTIRAPKSAILTLNTSDGTEDRFATTNHKEQGSANSDTTFRHARY